MTASSFFIIVAEGNIDTTYRQLTIVPVAAFFIALGGFTVAVILNEVFAGWLGKKWFLPLAVFICVALLAIFPIKRRDLFLSRDKSTPVHEYNWMLAQEIKKVASDNSKIILAGGYTIHEGGNDLSPILYYYSGLKGWSIQEGEWNETVIDDLKKRGATLLAAMAYDREAGLDSFMQTMLEKYKVLYSDPETQLLLISLIEKKDSNN